MMQTIFRNRWGMVGLTLLTLVFSGLVNTSAQAMMMASKDGVIRDCSPMMRMAEVQYGIPDRLLQAIAYAESGRTDPKNGRRVAWPWTINAEGDGFVFDSKTAAINRVRALRQQGVESIDVGCMQVNLIHHADAFDNLEQAFEPAHNIDYAARFLKSLQQETGSWAQAVAFYHSRNQNISDGYRQKVLSLWQKTRPDNSVKLASLAVSNQDTAPPSRLSSLNGNTPVNKSLANARFRAVAASNQGMGVSNPRLAMGSRVDAPRPLNRRFQLAMGTLSPQQMAMQDLGQPQGMQPGAEIAAQDSDAVTPARAPINKAATGIALPARGFPLPLQRARPIPLGAVAQNAQ